MKSPFILSCESTVDYAYDVVCARDIPVLFYTYTVDGAEYVDDMGRDTEALPRFYQMLADGKMPSTAQINEYRYLEFFEPLVQQGDLLHIAFGSGMTGSVWGAERAAQTLREKYPDRKIVIVDSLCSSSGYGMLVDMAADMRDGGSSIEQVESWLLENRTKVHHQFFSTDLKYFRRSGRMSGPAAMLGAVLSICPIMRLDDGGHIIAYDKVRGKKNAVSYTVRAMEEHAQGGTDYCGKCVISHSNCPADAEALRMAVEEKFPKLKGKIQIWNIGTIIASHCGPGTVAVFFMGDDRQPYRKRGEAQEEQK